MKQIVCIILFFSTLYAVTFDEAMESFNKNDYIEAYDKFSDLALNDDANAQYNIALMNYKGLVVNKNYKLAFF